MERKELENFAETVSGMSEVGDKGCLIHYLTKGRDVEGGPH
jgi:non-canonical (house-cleaning) NTP pyrophosphatase